MSRKLDWTSAQVEDAKLTVTIAGDAPEDWADYVSGVVDRLQRPSGRWGEIDVSEEQVEVEGVTRGAEADLHHLLESAMFQANAHFGAEDEDDDEDDSENEKGPADDDRRMTETFRAFADSR